MVIGGHFNWQFSKTLSLLDIRIKEHSHLVVLLLLLMMINKNLNTKETNVNIAASKGEKRKLSSQTTVEETKPFEVKKKAPLKAELIEKLKALEKKYKELEKENDI